MAIAVAALPASAHTHFFSGEITAGTITAESHGVSGAIATFDLAGPGFHLVGSGEGRISTCVADPNLCKPGSVVGLVAFFAEGVTGVATVNGETLDPAFFVVFSPVAGRGVEPFVETSAVVLRKGRRKTVVLSAPFTLQVSGLTVNIFNDRSEWFVGGVDPWASGVITGSGIATAFFERIHVKAGKESFVYYELRRIIYSFNAP